MKPIRLTLTAFGPYATREVVDFRAATAAGLFGIYGPTGSGKSSIFSAITFALFGEAAKADQDNSSLRSDHAAADLPTSVEFIFDLGPRRYVIRRRPDQDRPALRGTGMTRDAHEATLFDATGIDIDAITDTNPGKVIAEKKVGLVREAVQNLLGYGPNQFRQIILLPQGKFETFLSAKTDERLAILRDLFDVSLYRRMAAYFLEAAKEARGSVARAREVCSARLMADGFESPEALCHGIAAAQEALGLSRAAEETAQAQQAVAISALGTANALAARFKEAASAQDALQTVIAQGPAIAALQAEIAAIKRAQTLVDIEAQAAQAQDDCTKAEADEARAKSDLAQAKTQAETAAAQLASLEASEAAITQMRAALAEDLRHQKTLAAAQDHRAQAEATDAKQHRLEAAFDAQKAKVATLETLKQAKEAAQKAASSAEAKRMHITQSIADWSARRRAAQEFAAAQEAHQTTSTECARLQKAAQEAAQTEDQAKTAFDQAEGALANAQALHLAGKLAPGAPCPVCGSPDHPAPASGHAGAAGLDEAFRKARAVLDKARQSHEAAKIAAARASAKQETQFESLCALSAPEQDITTIDATLRDLTAQRDALGPVQEIDFEADLAEIAAKITSALTTQEDAQEARDTARVEAARAAQTLGDALASIPEPLRDPGRLAANIAKTQDEIAAHDTAKTRAQEADRAAREAVIKTQSTAEAAGKTHITLKERATQAQASFAARLTAADLSDQSYRALLGRAHRLDADEARVLAHDRALTLAQERANTSQAAIEGQTPPDLAVYEEAAKAAEVTYHDATQARARAQTHLEARLALQSSLAAEMARLDALEAETGPLRDLAALFNAENRERLDLETFAIGAMFDQVLTAANARLSPMTAGRFTLERAIEDGKGRARRGLGIRVFDLHTGKARATTTLSGGETFIAALALALGLSDIVERSSGTIRLDTIFIDEGFGSLDSENDAGTLDQVLQTLAGPAGARRTVGLISHVTLVQQAIPNGFYIRKTPAGSHIEARDL